MMNKYLFENGGVYSKSSYSIATLTSLIPAKRGSI